MVKLKDVNEAVNSARMVMVQYIIGKVRSTTNNLITFNENAYKIVSNNSNGDIAFYQPKSLSMYYDNDEISTTHCVLVMANESGIECDVYVHDLSADDLYSLCEMIYAIANDEITNVNIHEREIEDIEYEIIN